MTEFVFESPMGVNFGSLSIDDGGNEAVVHYSNGGDHRSIRFLRPRPLSSLVRLFDEFSQLRIVDQNSDGASLEFGRYQVQVWDEDNPYDEFFADSFSDSRKVNF